jgi:hypothetical protein
MAVEIKSAREAYMAILGRTSFPKTPNDLPERVFLTAPSYGDMVESVLGTWADGAERAQHIYWNRSRQSFQKGQLVRGDDWFVMPKDRIFSGLRDLPMVSFHTHPIEGIPRHSDRDIALDIFHPKGYISLVASELGVSGLFATSASEGSRGVFFKNIRFRVLQRALRHSQTVYSQYSSFKDKVESLGFGYYCANSETLGSDDLFRGMTLYKNMGNIFWEFD